MTPLSDMPPPTAPPSAGTDLGLVDALAQLSFLVHDALAEIAGQRGLSIVQMRLLGVLRDREPTMNELGRLLGLDKSSVSGLVDRAQRRGLVIRTVSATDRRAFHVSLTGTGGSSSNRAPRGSPSASRCLLPDCRSTDRQLLARLAAQILAADADRRGIDLRTAAG